ncbi:MAG: hypothetical protein ABJE10_00420 [bacterium]
MRLPFLEIIAQMHMSNVGPRFFMQMLTIVLCMKGDLGAQPTSATRLKVTVTVKSYTARGDTVDIAYVVRNDANSPEGLMTFALVTSVSPTQLSKPVDRHEWHTSTLHGDERIAIWTANDVDLDAGEATTPLHM